MTKLEIVKKIYKKTGISRTDVSLIVDETVKTIISSIEGGENVYLRGLGSFVIKKRAEKKARNITKNTTIIVPAHNVPDFIPSRKLSNKVKNNMPV